MEIETPWEASKTSVRPVLTFPEEYGARERLRTCVRCPIGLERRLGEATLPRNVGHFWIQMRLGPPTLGSLSIALQSEL